MYTFIIIQQRQCKKSAIGNAVPVNENKFFCHSNEPPVVKIAPKNMFFYKKKPMIIFLYSTMTGR
jgi:hypothetical protein